jgi:hypothetical protein
MPWGRPIEEHSSRKIDGLDFVVELQVQKWQN